MVVVVVVVTALRVGGETFEARGEVRKMRKKARRVRACVHDRAHLRRSSQGRSSPACRTGETDIGRDTAREGENLLLAEWGRLLLLLQLLPILLLPPRWWSPRLHKALLVPGLVPGAGLMGGDPGAHASLIRRHTSGCVPQNAQDHYQEHQDGCSNLRLGRLAAAAAGLMSCLLVFAPLMPVVVRLGVLVWHWLQPADHGLGEDVVRSGSDIIVFLSHRRTEGPGSSD